jgi:hypothetical protein
MVNNIDLEKLERIGERLKDLSDSYEQNSNISQRSDSLLITSQILSQVYDKKLELVRQEDEYSSAFGGFENTSSDNYPANSLGSPEFNIFDQSIRMHEEADEYDELEKQEQEIKKWKGIYQEMSRRLQESMNPSYQTFGEPESDTDRTSKIHYLRESNVKQKKKYNYKDFSKYR